MNADTEFAADLAARAGELLTEIRAGELGSTPIDPTRARELGRRGDREANALLLDLLAAGRPADAVLSEESADDLVRLDRDRVWIIDPLDGSKEYGLAGHTDWAVHVALWERGRGITDAAVAQPAIGAVYASGAVGLAARTPGPLRILVSGSRPPAFVSELAQRVGAEVLQMGSAGAKAMAVLRGEADAYVHAGGQWEWDSAAPVGVAQAAGLHCSRVDGSALRYNETRPYLPDLLICRPEVADTLLGEIATLTSEQGSQAIALAREYLGSLVTHDATKVRLAENCFRVENGQRTGSTGEEIRHELEHGHQYEPITGIRDLRMSEWGPNVVGRYLLDMRSGEGTLTVAITEHFAISGAEIAAITAIIEPHGN
ncbi:3'(2'),5'-bisphosphate nucleotidase CysQ [Rhodococcus spelaei]|uniref:3'(2'),5'-bisphosphate nucleotidase CysQ n=1 Tax=Rhodococcus spelaei TaxID=2546320 RepID=A0A541B076_9NOCA|nr:3'(2'),5'-bisphosphate nucleotidase CysQ [Rhodococcus spelaei]TQF65712.1 3'(2'),5'-bisphosphate nucleotidase CysQ [Rhodococcus spelaei]